MDDEKKSLLEQEKEETPPDPLELETERMKQILLNEDPERIVAILRALQDE